MSENEVCIDGEKVKFMDVREMIENHLMEAIFGRHFQRIYSDMNEYMENIFNSPSTVNRLLPYIFLELIFPNLISDILCLMGKLYGNMIWGK